MGEGKNNCMALIEVKNLTVKIGESLLLEDVSFVVEKGEFLCITGANGAGKTTLLKAILGLIPTTSGTISLFGRNRDSSARSRIGYLPQKNITINMLTPATALEVVVLGALSKKSFPKMVRKSDWDKARETLALFGAQDLAEKSFQKLSGGQQQRVLLARALMNDPEILCMDEPSTALDPNSREEFFRLVEKLNVSGGVTVLIVTHDMDYVGHYADTMLMLDRKVLYFGTAEAFLHKHHITHHHDYAGLSHAV